MTTACRLAAYCLGCGDFCRADWRCLSGIHKRPARWSKNLPPLIVADKAPIKVTPKKPIVNNIAAGDLNIYETIEGEASGAPDKDVSAEEKGDGSLETLYGDSQSAQQTELDELNAFLGEAETSAPEAVAPIEAPNRLRKTKSVSRAARTQTNTAC